jgi:type IX secretion system PorP/SprF family membrane protein
MKSIIKLSTILVLGLTGSAAQAQQAPLYTHYMYNTLSVNPGYAGSRDALTVTALHRSQWVRFKGAPLTESITLHTPLQNEHIGAGFSVTNDRIGPINNTSVFGDFAYRIKLNDRSKLAFGLSAGVNIFQANLSTLQLDQQTDPVFQNDVSNHITPNFGFGLYYSRECFYAGVSTPDLLQNTFSVIDQGNGNTLVAKEQRHYFLIAGTVIKVTDMLAFKPTGLIKMTPGAPVQADLTASFILAKKLLLGAMYRTGDSFGALIGLDLTDQLHVGYSYDWSFGLKTPTYNQGSHEIVLRYDFIFSSKKQIHSPRYF